MSIRNAIARMFAFFEFLEPFALRCAVAMIVVLAICSLASLAMRRRSASIQHRVLLLGMLGVLLMPLLTAMTRGLGPQIQWGNRETTRR